MSAARIGVVTFPGSLDDTDAARAVTSVGADAVRIWHTDTSLSGVDAVLVPGGFSYGDYLRAGAIARHSPVMSSIVQEAGSGLPVLGICNGFQILTEAHLLPGALTLNAHKHFRYRPQKLSVHSTSSVWTSQYSDGETIVIPIKHMEGRYIASHDTVAELEKNNQIVLRYVGNPNGSLDDIAAIQSESGTVLGLMPHPEHAIETLTGPSTDGTRFFTSMLNNLTERT